MNENDIQGSAGGERAGGGERTYTVQPGDTLSKISSRFYGDAAKHMDIYYANRDKIEDPDNIQVGQEITIPDPG